MDKSIIDDAINDSRDGHLPACMRVNDQRLLWQQKQPFNLITRNVNIFRQIWYDFCRIYRPIL